MGLLRCCKSISDLPHLLPPTSPNVTLSYFNPHCHISLLRRTYRAEHTVSLKLTAHLRTVPDQPASASTPTRPAPARPGSPTSSKPPQGRRNFFCFPLANGPAAGPFDLVPESLLPALRGRRLFPLPFGVLVSGGGLTRPPLPPPTAYHSRALGASQEHSRYLGSALRWESVETCLRSCCASSWA